MKYILAIIAAFHAGEVQAQDRVSFLFGSRHVDMSTDFNETNPGVFLTWEDAVGPLDVSEGVYLNSYENTTVIFTASYDVIEWENGAIGVFGGVAHYPVNGPKKLPCCGGWVPMGGFQMRQGNVFTQYIPMPGVGRYTRGIFTVGLTFDFK